MTILFRLVKTVFIYDDYDYSTVLDPLWPAQNTDELGTFATAEEAEEFITNNISNDARWFSTGYHTWRNLGRLTSFNMSVKIEQFDSQFIDNMLEPNGSDDELEEGELVVV